MTVPTHLSMPLFYCVVYLVGRIPATLASCCDNGGPRPVLPTQCLFHSQASQLPWFPVVGSGNPGLTQQPSLFRDFPLRAGERSG